MKKNFGLNFLLFYEIVSEKPKFNNINVLTLLILLVNYYKSDLPKLLTIFPSQIYNNFCI